MLLKDEMVNCVVLYWPYTFCGRLYSCSDILIYLQNLYETYISCRELMLPLTFWVSCYTYICSPSGGNGTAESSAKCEYSRRPSSLHILPDDVSEAAHTEHDGYKAGNQ